MLASKYRLKGRSNFARVEIDGKLIRSNLFGLGYYDRGDDLPSKFGFVVSTKISKSAVVRNRIKRIIADTIRINHSKIKKAHDVVFLIKPACSKAERQDIENETIKVIIKNLQK